MFRPTELSERATSSLALLTIACICAASWQLCHGYQGIVHDARLYTLQALAHLNPQSLGADVFLKFGSQDHFTIFSPTFALTSQLLGVEPAAALLTFVSQIALFICAWLLASEATNKRMGFVGLCAFIALPSDYGADRIFFCIEPFLTPRMLAEAIVLCALRFSLQGRHWLAIASLAIAISLHPLMALAGACAIFWLIYGMSNPRKTLAAIIVIGAAFASAAALLPPGSWGRFDSKWLILVTNRSPFLFLAHWQWDDWARVAISLTTLGLGMRVLPSPTARAAAKMTALVLMSGLALTLFACDFLQLVFITQLQPWRWQWLSTVMAALLLPEILRVLWSGPLGHRTAAFLLLASWIFGANSYALLPLVAAFGTLTLLGKLKQSEARLVHFGAVGMLAIAVIWRVASNLEFSDFFFLDSNIPPFLRHAMSFCRDGTAPMTAVVLALWLEKRSKDGASSIVLAAAAMIAVFGLVPYSWSNWSRQEYSSQQIAKFSSIKLHIPLDADVFWPEGPVDAWVLLGRPSYISLVQTSGMVFSQQSAFELDRRATALSSVIGAATFMQWSTSGGAGLNLSPTQLRQACDSGAFEFLVSHYDLGATSLAIASSTLDKSSRFVRLYHCPSQARAAAAST